nr:protein Diedel-like [Drosophila kikkawai]
MMPVPWLSSLILAVLCLLAYLRFSDAECCTTMAHLEFMMTNGNCGVVNAKKTVHGCSITVCGDGRALVGTFCGRGPCNIFGCDCQGGCLHGDYGQSFLARNQDFGITLMHTEIVDYAPGASMWYTLTNGIFNKIF